VDSVTVIVAAVRPHIVKDGEDIATIATRYGCTEDEIWNHPKNASLKQERKYKHALVKGDVVNVPDVPPRQENVAVQGQNRFNARVTTRTAHIRLRNAWDKPEPVGTKYRLTINAEVWTGELDEEGLIIKHKVPAGAKITVEWAEPVPAVEYAIPPNMKREQNAAGPNDDMAKSRARVLSTGSLADMQKEFEAFVDPTRDADGDCTDRVQQDAFALATPSHAHHTLAKKVAHLIESGGGDKWTNTTDVNQPWDNRWYSLHPLVARVFPVPLKKAAATGAVKEFRNKSDATLTPEGGAAPIWTATVRAGWYNRTGKAAHLLGTEKPPLTMSPESMFEDFSRLATVANKRLVKLWMSEVKRLVPASEHESWLHDWFGTDEGRVHFRNWCQLLVSVTQPGSGAHANGRAIDIDYLFNPWAPLYTEGAGLMGGEPQTDNAVTNAASGRAYDRALRLFVQSKKPDDIEVQAELFATNYYRNEWDWDPPKVHAIYRDYQALNASLVAYFDYRFGRASRTKDAGYVKAPNKYSNSCTMKCTKHEDPKKCGSECPHKRDGAELWGLIENDAGSGRVREEATLVLDVAPPKAIQGLFTKRALKYPFGQPVQVWVAPLRDLRARGKADATARRLLGDALAQQIEKDHSSLGGRIGRDACRGIFNWSYDVAMAFGLILEEARDYNRLRLFSFGRGAQANGGDFMHVDFGQDKRWIEHLDIEVDGQSKSVWRPKGASATATLRVKLHRANAGGTTNVTSTANVESDRDDICRVEEGSDARKLVAASEGSCTITAGYEGHQCSLAVIVEWDAP
jgi:hypothetical protein